MWHLYLYQNGVEDYAFYDTIELPTDPTVRDVEAFLNDAGYGFDVKFFCVHGADSSVAICK